MINVSGEPAFGPFFDEANEQLYYSNLIFDITPMKRIPYLNGLWGVPEILSENVNGFWIPNYCNRVLTSDASAADDATFLFYGKEIWEPSLCIDFTNFLYLSHRLTTEVAEDNNPFENFEITVYPNPSNSSFNFHVDNDGREYRLSIYDITGRVVIIFQTDNPSISWICSNSGGNSLGAGIYFVKFDCEMYSVTKKLLYLK